MSFVMSVSTGILLIAKTVASGLVNCQESNFDYVCSYAAKKLLNKLSYKLSIISLLNIMQCLLLAWHVSNGYVMTSHTMQGGVV